MARARMVHQASVWTGDGPARPKKWVYAPHPSARTASKIPHLSIARSAPHQRCRGYNSKLLRASAVTNPFDMMRSAFGCGHLDLGCTIHFSQCPVGSMPAWQLHCDRERRTYATGTHASAWLQQAVTRE